MAKQQDRGTKREDPETGKKFYDLNKDPVVSPYTGKSYPRSFFEQIGPATSRKASAKPEVEEEEEEEEIEVAVEKKTETAVPEIVSLEEADAEESGEDEEIPDVEGVEDVEEIGEDGEDTFLEEDEDEDEDLAFDVNTDDER